MSQSDSKPRIYTLQCGFNGTIGSNLDKPLDIKYEPIQVVHIDDYRALEEKVKELEDNIKVALIKNSNYENDRLLNKQLIDEKESFYHDYRMKFDIETKMLHQQLQSQKDAAKILIEGLEKYSKDSVNYDSSEDAIIALEKYKAKVGEK